MTPERQQEIDRIFEAALERAEPKRPTFLDEACAGDPSLRREVEVLLDALKIDGGVIDKATQLEAGHTVSRYRIIRPIGEGGMGEVYLAKDTMLGREVALKLLPAQFTTDKDRLSRFQQEAQSTSALNHPNILTIHEIGESDGTHFIATEFIEGDTLRDYVSNRQLPLSEALEITIQVADALDAAHDAKIVHRDIKPENIMIRRRDRLVKVLDFGLAKLAERPQSRTASSNLSTRALVKTDPGMVMGTVNYMSPEQTRGREVDYRTDIWSLGVVLYELVTRRLPFRGETSNDVISAILRDEPAPLAHYSKDVPEELERIVTRALRKRSDERYQQVREVALDLKTLKQRLVFEAELERSLTPEELEQRQRVSSVGKRLSSHSGATLIESSSVSSQAQYPNNLSGTVPHLIGREQETAEVERMLRSDDVRLVTLTGVGGTGKTSLAQSVAQEVLTEFADGVFFIDLSVINDPQFVISSIAQPLGVKESGGKALADVLKDYVRDRAMLLILDNFEQVTEAASEVADLLAIAPKLKVLVTSRAVLRLTAEREFAVPPLALPASDHLPPLVELQKYSAIALFVERARIVKTNFTLTDENSSAVASICMRLDGLPLAIELAAARIRVLSPPAILARLESQLKLLIGGARDLPARQQTMRGAIAWSYELLDEDEKTLLNRLSVFAGGATLEAAEAVCSGSEIDTAHTAIEVLDGIASLVDKSLLLQKEQADGEMRFRLLEAVREYARECLHVSGASEAIEQQHADYFLALAEKAEPELRGPKQAEWLNRLEDEHDNLRAALAWSLVHDTEGALRLAGAVTLLWTTHGHYTEARRWLGDTLRKGGDAAASVRAKALSGAAQLARLQGDYESSRGFFEESLRLGRATGDRKRIAVAARGLGGLSYQRGDYVAAHTFLEESLAIGRELGDKRVIANVVNTLGELARIEGDYGAARLLYEETLDLARQSGNERGLSVNLSNLGAIAYHEGDFVAARSFSGEALMTFQKLGHKAGLSYSMDGLAALVLRSGDAERAAKISGAAEHLSETIGYELEAMERAFRDRYVAEILEALGEEAFTASIAKGRALRLNEAIALALMESVDE